MNRYDTRTVPNRRYNWTFNYKWLKRAETGFVETKKFEEIDLLEARDGERLKPAWHRSDAWAVKLGAYQGLHDDSY